MILKRAVSQSKSSQKVYEILLGEGMVHENRVYIRLLMSVAFNDFYELRSCGRVFKA